MSQCVTPKRLIISFSSQTRPCRAKTYWTKTYWAQNILGNILDQNIFIPKHIVPKTYSYQNILEPKHIRPKTYWTKICILRIAPMNSQKHIGPKYVFFGLLQWIAQDILDQMGFYLLFFGLLQWINRLG